MRQGDLAVAIWVSLVLAACTAAGGAPPTDAHHKVPTLASISSAVTEAPPVTVAASCDYRAGPLRWRELQVAGSPPSERAGAAVGFDSLHDRLLVFGGYRYPAPPGCPYLQDLWELRFSPEPVWNKLDVGSAVPRARSGGAGAFDPVTGELLVFGGDNWCTGKLDLSNPMDDGMNDVWALSTALGTWSRVHPTGPLPSSRWSLQAELIPTNQALVIQGGYNSHYDYLGDTWALERGPGTAHWRRLTGHGAGPGERSYAYHWYDPERALMVVAGGNHCPGSCPLVNLDDGFVLEGLDRPGSQGWEPLSVAENIPARFVGRLCAYDPKAHRATCPRGRYYPGPADSDNVGVESFDTWTFTFDGPRSGRFEKLDTGGTWPAGWGTDLVYDPKRDRFVAFGGAKGTPSFGTFGTTNEVWVLERDWSRAPCTPAPVHRP